MEKMKLQIELNDHPYNDNVIYAAVSLRGGYTTRNYVVGDSLFNSNHAFYNILFNYYRLLNEFAELHYDVQRAVSTISFCKKKTVFMSVLQGVLHTLFNHEYDSEKFEAAKKNARAAFAFCYKNSAFRSKYKGHEFSDLNKRFTLKKLIDDIEEITFEDFVKSANTLVIPSNVCVYISGEIDELDFSAISFENYSSQFSNVSIAGYNFDPYLRQDAHVINRAREDHNLIIESLDFFNGEITNFTKMIIAEILAERVPGDEVDVWVDSLDASIMFTTEKLDSCKGLLTINDKKAYEEAHERLIKKYVLLLENNPEHFAVKAANMMTVGIYIDQYLEFLDKCSFEMFNEICMKADYKITEAQIVLRKESK